MIAIHTCLVPVDLGREVGAMLCMCSMHVMAMACVSIGGVCVCLYMCGSVYGM